MTPVIDRGVAMGGEWYSETNRSAKEVDQPS